MAKGTLLAGVSSSFAHLAGIGRARAADDGQGAPISDDNGDEARRAEEDETARRAALTDDEREKEDETARRAALTDDQRQKEDEDARKARAADGDDKDDDEDEMKGRSAAAEARRRERARCAAIFAHPRAAANVALAASLAFETTLTRTEAIAVLRSAPVQAGGRADRNPTLGPGGQVNGGAKAIADSWSGAFARAGVREADRPLYRG